MQMRFRLLNNNCGMEGLILEEGIFGSFRFFTSLSQHTSGAVGIAYGKLVRARVSHSSGVTSWRLRSDLDVIAISLEIRNF
ncbi:hypothetical protein GCM10023225_09020 [Kineococcus glutinatus]|uniref:Uncharacterized protein n=1 Tax=Kineococcus glutinatus TaxID=1070872 RepID=A0ABP9HEB3_9ACTN